MKSIELSWKFCVIAICPIILVGRTIADDTDKLPSAQTILKKYADACGGVEKLKEIKSLRMSGEVNIESMQVEGTIEMHHVAPDKLLLKADMGQFGEQIQGCSGDIGWEISDMGGSRILKGREFDRLKEEANFRKMYDPESFYKSMEALEISEVAGTKCYKLKLTKKNDEQVTEFYSVETGLQVASESVIPSQMGEIPIKTFNSDYQEFNGIKFPTTVTMHLPNSIVQAIHFKKIEINPTIPESTFSVPDDIKLLMEESEK